MFKLRRCYFCYIFILVISVTASLALKYEAPDSCTWSVDNNETSRVAVWCKLRTLPALQNAVQQAPLSALQAEGTTRLRLECSDVLFFESSLTPGAFQHLSQLEELELENCKLSALPEEVFRGLRDLKRLSVRTHNALWSSSRQLEVNVGSFEGLRELQILELCDNNMREVPRHVFCGLVNLNVLNLSRNALEKLDPALLGAQDEGEGEHDCTGADVLTLDVSHNQLADLPSLLSSPRRRRLQHLLVHENQLTALRASSLAGLANLRVINASSNRLVDLPAVPLRETCRELREVHLRDNALHALGDTFARLEQLLVLDVARNQLVNLATSLAGLIRLIVLDLAGNALTRLEPLAFKDLYSLQILDLRDNAIANVADDAFLPLYNLHTLNLAGNRLASVGPSMLNGLFVLNKLTLSLNLITDVDPRAFRNCSDLKELDLSGNVLTEVPAALAELPFLRTLDLGENRIAGFRNGSFRNLGQLTGLRLIDNNIGNVTADMLWDLTGLQVLNLAKNKIQHVERGSFERNERLEAIRLDANYLTDVNGVFTALPALVWLNLSDNHLVWFDYAFVPPSLQWLDIHANFVEKLGNYYEIVDGFHLRTIDVSQNRLTELSPLSLPNSVEIFFASNNRVRVLAPATFREKRNLTRVDLYGNELQHVDLASLTVQGRDELPEFFLGGNPFSCDCTMEWLRNHSAVMDLDDVTCDVESARAFLCRYETRCAPSCTCCANSSCQCNRKCPTNCTCYRDESWDLNVVDCASSGHVGLPRNIPSDATELHLDGNKIREVKRLERTSLLVLYLNRSRIETIQNGAFIALDTLELLYLQENNLEVLYGHEFEGLGFLRELYLQNNRLVHVNNATFAPLYTLQLLRLDGNLLASFAIWQMLVQNPDLNEMFLANNPWACRCRFSTSLRRWMKNSSGHVMGGEQCLNSFADTDVCEFESDEVVPDVHNYVVAIIATSLLLLLLLLVLMIRQRDELRLWLFSRYNVRLFCSTVPEEKDKLYDAYLVYSPKDEEQLVQYLSLGLESGYPRYTLCLHHRDLPQDPRAVVAAAESSRRVILVVTRSFLQTEWPRRELRTALAEALRARAHRVLVIEEVGGLPPELERDPELRPLMSQRLRWGEKRFWERLRFAMPEARQYRQNLNFTVDVNGAGQTHGTFPGRRKHPLFDLAPSPTQGAPAANKPPVVRSPPPVYPLPPPVAESEPVYSSINEEYGTWHPQARAYLV